MIRRKSPKIIDRLFRYTGLISTYLGLFLLTVFILNILIEGLPRLNFQFLSSFPSRFPEKAGILTAWSGTLWIIFLTAVIAVPVGIAGGIYLEEYAKKNRLNNFLEINISNLAGVPSIIYGIFGLEIFVRTLHLGHSILAGSLTLSLLVLPIIIVTTRESLRAVPDSIREASYALGATQWQTIKNQLLPASFSSIITGIILALSRAIGETAPLIVIGALAFVPFTPKTPMDEFTVLPMQIFNWISRPQHGFIINAAAAIIVLLVIVFVMNGIAIYFRNKSRKKLGL